MAKSSNHYAGLYAEENLISSKNIIASARFEEGLREIESRSGMPVNAVIIVDDIIGTGRSLEDNIKEFVTRNSEAIKHRSLTVLAVAIMATSEGETKVRKALSQIPDLTIDLRITEILGERHNAFEKNGGIWSDAEEASRAKELVYRLESQPGLGNCFPIAWDGSIKPREWVKRWRGLQKGSTLYHLADRNLGYHQ